MTSADAEAIIQAVGEKSTVLLRRASFVSVDSNNRAVVTMGDSNFPAEFTTSLIPEPGEAVNTLTVDDRVLLLGPSRPKPGRGTVLSVASNMAKVQTSVGEFTMPYVGSAPAVTDIVGIIWSEGPIAVGKLSTTPVVTPPPPDGGVQPQIRSAVFNVIDTGSSDRGSVRWWTGQPWASDSTYGAWFYGTQISDTIPAAATLVSLEFYSSPVQIQGGQPRFALHTGNFKTTLPSFGSYTEWTPGAGWNYPPSALAATWFAGLKAGGGYGGVGLNQGGLNKFSSRAQDSMTGALRIAWRA